MRNKSILSICLLAVLASWHFSAAAAAAQDDACCFQAYKNCGVCKDDPDPAKRTENLTYSWCGVTGYYGQNPNSPGASAKLKACQQCIDRACPAKGSGKKAQEDKPIDRNKIVQIRPENSNYSWCTSTFSSVYVDAMPPSDDLTAMAVYDGHGRMGDVYAVGERGKFPGRTWVLSPENPVYGQRYPWDVNVLMPGATVTLESNANLRLPCKVPESAGERERYRLELAGGKMNWFWQTITLQQNNDFPELYEVETKEVIGGVKDGLTWIRGGLSDERPISGVFLNASYQPFVVPEPAPPGEPHIIFDASTPGTTRVTVYRGEVTLKPKNRTLRPVTVRSGQSASVTATTVSPISTFAGQNGGSAAYIGCFKDTNVFDLNGFLERSSRNTPQTCIANCKARGFKFAGVQYGESCLCGNSYGRYGTASNCNMKCTGDPGQNCGGYSANAVYSTGAAVSAPASSGCGVGRRWTMINEYNSRSVWTRIGDSNVFDAVYTYSDGSRYADKPKVTLNGLTVTARIDYDFGGGNCIYTGTLSPDGRSASGTFTCTIDPGKRSKWNAEIFCQ